MKATFFLLHPTKLKYVASLMLIKLFDKAYRRKFKLSVIKIIIGRSQCLLTLKYYYYADKDEFLQHTNPAFQPRVSALRMPLATFAQWGKDQLVLCV